MTGDDPQTRAAVAAALYACADDLEIRAARYDGDAADSDSADSDELAIWAARYEGLADGYTGAAEYLRGCADKIKKGDA